MSFAPFARHPARTAKAQRSRPCRRTTGRYPPHAGGFMAKNVLRIVCEDERIMAGYAEQPVKKTTAAACIHVASAPGGGIHMV